MELAVTNISGGSDLSETGVISTTLIAAASNSATLYYSTTARTSVAYRVVGYIESTQATAGTWATAPSTIQGYGGCALDAMSSLGYGQTWQSPTRAYSTTYYNTTGKPILINVHGYGGNNLTFSVTVDGVVVGGIENSTGATLGGTITAIVPIGKSYSASGSLPLDSWTELR
jgi:type II secretory pathway pseudopilin PulG